MTRRITAALGLLTLVPLCGCQVGRFSLKADPIHIGTTRLPILGAVLVPGEYLALQANLEKLYDRAVLLEPGLSPSGIASHLAAGRHQFAILTATEYASITDVSNLELVAAGVGEGGSQMYKGLILASAKSDVQSLADVRGKRFAFGPAKDLLLDYAAHTALSDAGVSDKDIKDEIPLPPLFAKRIHLANSGDIAKTIAFDGGVPAGVVDEATYKALPDSGGSFLTGPSKDLFRQLGETPAVPGMIVVAGIKADPVTVQKMKAFLLERVRPDKEPEICKQMKVSGFADPDRAAYEAARRLASRT